MDVSGNLESGVESSAETSETAPEATGAGVAGTGTEASAAEKTSAPPGSEVSAEKVVPPQYTPNFKYKFTDAQGKQTEAEIDEWLRDKIRDQESEKKLRELYERSYGLDFVKADRQRTASEYQKIKAEHEAVVADLQAIGTHIKEGDLESVFTALGLSKDQVLEYAIKEAQYRRMEPDQRAQLDAQRQEKEEFRRLRQENERLQAYYEQQAIQNRTQELDSTLSRPDINAIVEAFDTRMGRPGAFRAEVIRRGQNYAIVHKKDVSAEELVKELIALVGPQTPTASQTVTSQREKPVIPNIPGRSVSPVKKVPKSLDDLRRLANELA